MNHKISGQGLIGTLIAVALLLVLTLVFLNGFGLAGKNQRKDKVGETIVGQSIARAKDEKCMAQLSQLRQSIEINTDSVEGGKPQSLQDTKLGSDFYKCPIGGEPYQYDAATGKVRCVHPGHEKY